MFYQKLLLLGVLLGVAHLTNPQETGAEAPKPFDLKAAHKLFMLYAWTVLADVIVLLAFYGYRKYAKWIHAILGTGIIVTTLVTSLPALLKNGFNTKHLTHYIIGVVIYGVMGLQLLLGVTKFLMVFFNKGSPFAIYVFKAAHKYLGYALLIVAKVQIFIFLPTDRTEYSVLLGWSIAAVIIFFYRLFTFPKLASTILPPGYAKKSVTTLGQIGAEEKSFIIFGNYVYDLAPLKDGHPAGAKIITAIKDESSDKYVYGMASSETEARVPRYSHSEASFHLLGKPMARIDILSPFQGFEGEVVKVKVVKVQAISDHLYEVSLAKDEGFNFSYRGYSHENQIGRFYSLTVDRSITRLYTSVNFLTRKNKELLKAAYFDSLDLQTDYATSASSKSDLSLLNESVTGNFEDENYLPLLIKQYEDGKLTKGLLSLEDKSLHLSSERGFGLSLPSLQPGKIVVVAAGTGLFPFCDLIDLLFKSHLQKTCPPNIGARILSQNPILSRDPFGKFTFEFFGSFHQIEDLHKITLHQVQYLTKHSSGFQFLFRLNNKPAEEVSKSLGIRVTEKRFEELLSGTILTGGLSKVWVCGPPRMNVSLRRLLEKTLSKSQFQIF